MTIYLLEDVEVTWPLEILGNE